KRQHPPEVKIERNSYLLSDKNTLKYYEFMSDDLRDEFQEIDRILVDGGALKPSQKAKATKYLLFFDHEKIENRRLSNFKQTRMYHKFIELSNFDGEMDEENACNQLSQMSVNDADRVMSILEVKKTRRRDFIEVETDFVYQHPIVFGLR
ncbi:hypothetical protein OAL44_02515, partial [Planctomycetaceae bacterium]|nr:hypothetical protein [Planctomycetaceae bacterium]